MPPLSSLARWAGCALARAPKSTELQEQLLPHTAAWEAPTAPRRGRGTGSTHLIDGVLRGAALLCWQLQRTVGQ